MQPFPTLLGFKQRKNYLRVPKHFRKHIEPRAKGCGRLIGTNTRGVMTHRSLEACGLFVCTPALRTQAKQGVAKAQFKVRITKRRLFIEPVESLFDN